jgi:hypothetical protein
MICISTLSKYVRENKHKKPSFVPDGTSIWYKCLLPRWRGEGTLVLGRGSMRYKCVAFVLGITPGTNAPPHLYWMVCTSWIHGTNEGYQPVKMPVFTREKNSQRSKREAAWVLLARSVSRLFWSRALGDHGSQASGQLHLVQLDPLKNHLTS